MSMPRITILMPTYNKEAYIAQAIDSVLMQLTCYDFDLLIIDDKSTDNSLEIAKQYQSQYPEVIKIIEKEKNEGCLSTMLKGYENLKLDYFCVLDPDDYWISEYKLQNAIHFLENHLDFTMYVSDAYVDKEGKQTPYLDIVEDMDFDFDHVDNLRWGVTSGMIYRNVIFYYGVPDYLYHQVGSKNEVTFEGDSYRNIIHLQKGKLHVAKDIESVYRIQPNGIWSSRSKFDRNVLNAELFLTMFHCLDKIKPEFFIIKCWRFCKANLELMYGSDTNSFKLNHESEFVKRFYDVMSECLHYLDFSSCQLDTMALNIK